MKFIIRHKGAFWAGAAALLIVLMAVLSFFTKDGTSPLSNGVNFLFRPLHAGIGGIADRITDTRRALEEYDTLREQYDNLLQYVEKMDDELRRANKIAAQNDELRELLGLDLSKRTIEYIAATIVSRDHSARSGIMTLSKGTEAGIHKNMAVVSSAGYLVGIISESGAGWSRVTTIIDPNFGCGAKLYRTGQWTVAEGDWNLMTDGQLKLLYLSPDDDVQNGDLVFTSGDGGVFPNDIRIGTAVAFQREESGQNSYAVIQPKVDLDELVGVYIIKSFDTVE